MLNSNNIIVVVSLTIVGWFLLGILRWIGRLFTRAPVPVDQQALDWEAVRRITTTPVLLPDGTWQMPQLAWKPCDAPMLANNLEVHDPRAPGHDRANCKHCNAKPNHSGVSYRPN